MPSFTDLVDNLEKLAFEVLMWIIFVPKTLTKVFINPSWAPAYVKRELDKDSGERFKEYMSPVFLLVISSVIPFAISHIIPATSVQLVGPQEGIVDEEIQFFPQETFLWSTLPVYYYYEVYIYDPEVDDFEVLASEEKWLETLEEESFDASFSYSWEQPGDYWVYLYIENGMDEWAEYSHFISIYEEEEFYYLTDSFEGDVLSASSDGIPVPSQKKPPQSRLNQFSEVLKGERTLIEGLIFLAFPLLFSLVIERFRKESINRENLREMFYIQCLYFSPLYFGLSSLILAEPFYFISEEDSVGNPSEMLFVFTIIWFLLIIIWFLYNEARVIVSEFSGSGFSKWQGVGVFLLCLIGSAFLGGLGAVLVADADTSKLFAWNIYNWGFGLLLLFGAYRFVRRVIFRRGWRKQGEPD